MFPRDFRKTELHAGGASGRATHSFSDTFNGNTHPYLTSSISISSVIHIIIDARPHSHRLQRRRAWRLVPADQAGCAGGNVARHNTPLWRVITALHCRVPHFRFVPSRVCVSEDVVLGHGHTFFLLPHLPPYQQTTTVKRYNGLE